MNNYPQWWNTTLTIYNRFIDYQTQITHWYKHTVNNCFWSYDGSKLTVGNVIVDSTSILCRIPIQSNFKEGFEWIQLPNDEKNNYLTLNPHDIIVRGNVSDEINEYVQGQRSTDLIKKYKDLQGCTNIQQVSINTGGGRVNEHYLVRGD